MDGIALSRAARLIGTDEHPVSVQSIHKAARRLNVLGTDESGRRVIPSAIVNAFRDHYRRTGYLHRRGAKSPAGVSENGSAAE